MPISRTMNGSRKNHRSRAARTWPETRLDSVDAVLSTLIELRGKNWLCRGQANAAHSLVPTMDRGPLAGRMRSAKLALERRSINTFRSIARYFADEGERAAVEHDVGTLMVLRHYSVPTRLLDWTGSPFVAAYFAAQKHDTEDGAIWAFDQRRYEVAGHRQWQRWPETTVGGKGEVFQAELTAFRLAEPPNWFVCFFYPKSFPRQRAQDGAYSMTGRFDRDHAAAIAALLRGAQYHHRFVITASVKSELRAVLREQHGIWEGALYPDSAGAARIAGDIFASSDPTPGPRAERR